MTVREIYAGSNGEATTKLYCRLGEIHPAGAVALNLFRAHKCSARAKVYRGGNSKGRYRDMAYDRKAWSVGLLTGTLHIHAGELGIRWGWKIDPKQEVHRWVLYVDIPTGQVSFHAENRGLGPDYEGEWCGDHLSADRIIQWCEQLLGEDGTKAGTRTQVCGFGDRRPSR